MRRVGSQNDKSLLRCDTFGSFVKLYHTCSLVIEYFGEAVLHHLTAAPGATDPLLPSLSYPLHLRTPFREFLATPLDPARLRNDLYCVGWGVKLYSNQKLDPARRNSVRLCPRRAGCQAAVGRCVPAAAAEAGSSSRSIR